MENLRIPHFREFISIWEGTIKVKNLTGLGIKRLLRVTWQTVFNTCWSKLLMLQIIFMILAWLWYYRNYGVQNPSWSEIHHFTKFLDLQLESCEKSVFCDETFIGDVMSGLKGFVVKFMMRMSRVYLLLFHDIIDDLLVYIIHFRILQLHLWKEK